MPAQPDNGEDRGRTRNREEPNKQRRAEAKLRRENAQQEGANTNEPTRRSYRGQETSKGNLPEKSRQCQGAKNKELSKGNCQGQGVTTKTMKDGAAKAREPIGRNQIAGEDRLRATLERLVHLQQIEGMDTYGGGSEGP